MFKTVKFTLLSVFFFCATIVNAQTETKEPISESFFKTFKKDPAQAYTDLFKDNKWMKDKQADIETVKIKLKSFLDGLGQYYGYEFIIEKAAGKSYIYKSFLVKYERQPIRFSFLLYKPDTEWQIQNFTYDTNIESEIEEAAKAYRLRENW